MVVDEELTHKTNITQTPVNSKLSSTLVYKLPSTMKLFPKHKHIFVLYFVPLQTPINYVNKTKFHTCLQTPVNYETFAKVSQNINIRIFVLYFVPLVCVQVTIVLKQKLEDIGVDVRVETFEEGQGIAALGEDPFVSCSKVVHSELHQCFVFIHTHTQNTNCY